MKLFCVRNLTEQAMTECQPWEFQPMEFPSEKVRFDKQARQEFYRTTSTQWNFYTIVEPSNPNIRPSKENPARLLHGIVADYDIKLTIERIQEAISAMKIKPCYIEKSLGGGARLVWLFPRPLYVEDSAFCGALLQAAKGWLNLDLLPSLDEPALINPTRLFCNGGEWVCTGSPPINENALQSFFVEAGRKHRFKGEDNSVGIPLDLIEKAILEKYPNFSWPSEFKEGSQGPSWFIAESVSPLSAIIKPDGVFTFSAHAEKPFYTWADILGIDFVKDFAEQSITKATTDIYWDGKRFWRKKSSYYVGLDMTELLNHFKVECRLSSKADKSGQSVIDRALSHIYNVNHVTGAAPFLFRPSGIIDFMGRRVLNTYVNRAMPAAEEGSVWGDGGKFPFLSAHFDNLFDPFEQKFHFLAWFKAFYESAVSLMPMPGQNTYLMGPAGVGKTLTSRLMVGKAVGGYSDASDFLLHGAAFNSDLFEAPLWCIDDDSPGENTAKQANFFAAMKKLAANQQFKHNKKFEVSVMTEWAGRALCTTNLDYVSSRMLGPMDDTSLDKTNIFRCVKESKTVFPKRYELANIIDCQLPYFLRWLVSWEPPDFVVRDVRYGYRAYHEPTLLDQSHQSNRIAPVKEVVIEALREYFLQNKEATEWRGSVVQLVRMLLTQPMNDYIIRSIRLEQINRYLEQIQREGLIQCAVETGDLKMRVWVFARFGDHPAKVEPPAIPAVQVVNIFSK